MSRNSRRSREAACADAAVFRSGLASRSVKADEPAAPRRFSVARDDHFDRLAVGLLLDDLRGERTFRGRRGDDRDRVRVRRTRRTRRARVAHLEPVRRRVRQPRPTWSRSASRRRCWRTHGRCSRSARSESVVSGLFVLCAALRLARFNVQTASADKSRFVGLPVPGAAAMIAGIVLAYSYFEIDSPRTLCTFMVPITLDARRPDDLARALPEFQNDQARKRAQIELVIVHDGLRRDAVRDAAVDRLPALGRLRAVGSISDAPRRTLERQGLGTAPGRGRQTARGQRLCVSIRHGQKHTQPPRPSTGASLARLD